MRVIRLAACLLCGSLAASDYPLWDGHESVADNSQRPHLDPEKLLDLGHGVKLELVLIPAGQFIMGAAKPDKPTITVFSAQVLLAIGGVLVLALLVSMLFRKRGGRRFSFSLRWLVAFCVSCGFMVWGGVRWYQSNLQSKAYDAAMARDTRIGDDEKPARPVVISTPFYMGKYPVTQEQYEAVTGQNPSCFIGPRNPVDTVSWNDLTTFCMKLSAQQAQQPGMKIAIPTEAQWEFACRAGTRTAYYSGDQEEDLARVGWYASKWGMTSHPVGQKMSNSFGLYDMHGNVWEWCRDTYTGNTFGLNPVDPYGDKQSPYRVLRGGSWGSDAWVCRASFRYYCTPEFQNGSNGFRVVGLLDF